MNVRTLKNNDDLTELEEEMKERKIDILEQWFPNFFILQPTSKRK